MAVSKSATAVANGSTAVIDLTEQDGQERESGRYVLAITCGTWSTTAAALELSLDGTAYIAATDADGAVSASADYVAEVPGGVFYRITVTNYANPVTIAAQRVSV